MVLEYFYVHIPIGISLGIVFSLLAGGIILSLYHKSSDGGGSSSSSAGQGDHGRHKTENGSLSASSSSTVSTWVNLTCVVVKKS